MNADPRKQIIDPAVLCFTCQRLTVARWRGDSAMARGLIINLTCAAEALVDVGPVGQATECPHFSLERRRWRRLKFT